MIFSNHTTPMMALSAGTIPHSRFMRRERRCEACMKMAPRYGVFQFRFSTFFDSAKIASAKCGFNERQGSAIEAVLLRVRVNPDFSGGGSFDVLVNLASCLCFWLQPF